MLSAPQNPPASHFPSSKQSPSQSNGTRKLHFSGNYIGVSNNSLALKREGIMNLQGENDAKIVV